MLTLEFALLERFNMNKKVLITGIKYALKFRGSIIYVEYINSVNNIHLFEDIHEDKEYLVPDMELQFVNEGNFYSISTDLVKGIISRKELNIFYADFNKENVLISIRDPKSKPLSINHFSDTLMVDFWDIEEDIGSLKVINNEVARNIKDFILKHKNKTFVINCEAGMSRSSGTAMAVECLLLFNGNINEYMKNNSEIIDFPRYTPNMEVFNKIVLS